MLKQLFCAGFLCFAGVGIADEWQMPPATISNDSTLNLQSLSEADNNGHAMLLGQNGSNELNAYYYANGAWTLSTNLLTSPSLAGSYDVAMEPSGTALAIFADENDGTIHSRYFNGTSWSTPTPDPVDTTIAGFFQGIKAALNGPGNGVGAWINTSNLVASFFSAGTWGPSQVLVASTNVSLFPNSVAYSANGTVAVSWADFNDNIYYIANYNGTTWQPAQPIGPATTIFTSMGLDANGNVYVAGIDGTDINVVHFNANTSTIVSTQTINTTAAIDVPWIAVAPNGTAVVIWDGLSSVYNGTTWSAEFPFAFGSDVPVGESDVSVDTNGNALAVWSTSDGSIVASRMALGSGVWSQPSELVAPPGTGITAILLSALSANGVGFAAWQQQVGEFDFTLFANASILDLLPPTMSGTSCSNKFATQSDFVNIITFTPSPSTGVIAYNLRRNGVLIAIIPATGPYTYVDHNLTKGRTYVYTLTAVNSALEESVPAILVL